MEHMSPFQPSWPQGFGGNLKMAYMRLGRTFFCFFCMDLFRCGFKKWPNVYNVIFKKINIKGVYIYICIHNAYHIYMVVVQNHCSLEPPFLANKKIL